MAEHQYDRAGIRELPFDDELLCFRPNFLDKLLAIFSLGFSFTGYHRKPAFSFDRVVHPPIHQLRSLVPEAAMSNTACGLDSARYHFSGRLFIH